MNTLLEKSSSNVQGKQQNLGILMNFHLEYKKGTQKGYIFSSFLSSIANFLLVLPIEWFDLG